MHIQTVNTTFGITIVLCAIFVGALAVMRLFFRYAALKRCSRRADERIRQTDDVTDQLLQGVQGLLLTFHVAAQKLGEDHASKKLMEHALSEADELLSVGRRRFEQVSFHSQVDPESKSRCKRIYSATRSYLEDPHGGNYR